MITIILSVLLSISTIAAISYAYLFHRGRHYNNRLFARIIELQDEVDRKNRVANSKK